MKWLKRKVLALARALIPDYTWAARETLVDMEIRELKSELRERDPNALALFGYKVYSQCDEDGIIERIFELIGEKTRLFVEAGCGNGIENNTHNLLLKGWRGVWVDGDPENIAFIHAGLNYRPNDVLVVSQAFISTENANAVVKQELERLGIVRFPAEIDFCSLDLDGNEFYVWEVLRVIEPRVLCIEYNARFPPPMELTIQYMPDHKFEGDDYQGASLQMIVNALEPKGYRLVACSISGVNAFFVKAVELRDIDPGDARRIYMPPRYYLTTLTAGFGGSLKYARDRIAQRIAHG